MSPFPHTVGADQTLAVAKSLMQEHNIRHLPVRSFGEIVGVLTERDIHFSVAIEKKTAEQLKVESAYTREPFIVAPDTPLDVVALKMAHEHIGCAIVVDKGELVGIFTTVDACRALGELAGGRLEQ